MFLTSLSLKEFERSSKVGFSAVQRQLKTILKIKDLKFFWQGKKVLDAGCGTGSDVIRLRRLGAEAYGLDLRKFSRSHHFILGNVTKMPFKDQEFDIVFSKWLIDLLNENDLENFVKESYRVLKPNGYFIVACLLTVKEIATITNASNILGFKLISGNLGNYLFVLKKQK